MQSVVLIPSLNPDEKLIRLLEGLHELDIRDILLVDDGSKPETKHYFEQARQMGCRVVTHAVNLGKGRALKTGFKGVYGSPIYTYIRTYKMNVAASMLVTDRKKKIIDVAASVGYDNPSKFAAAFKELFGMSPAEYRNDRR